MSEKAAERMVEDDANSAAVDAWRHPIEAVPETDVIEPQTTAQPSEHTNEPKKEPAKEPEKKKS